MVACLLAIGASLLAMLVAPALAADSANRYVVLFLAAVIVSAWHGGLGPGLLSTSASVVLADYFFERPIFVLTLTQRDSPQ